MRNSEGEPRGSSFFLPLPCHFRLATCQCVSVPRSFAFQKYLVNLRNLPS
jgi:hypothetical protein